MTVAIILVVNKSNRNNWASQKSNYQLEQFFYHGALQSIRKRAKRYYSSGAVIL